MSESEFAAGKSVFKNTRRGSKTHSEVPGDLDEPQLRSVGTGDEGLPPKALTEAGKGCQESLQKSSASFLQTRESTLSHTWLPLIKTNG